MKFRIINSNKYKECFAVQNKPFKWWGWVNIKVFNNLEKARKFIQEIREGERDKYGDKIIAKQTVVIEEYEI